MNIREIVGICAGDTGETVTDLERAIPLARALRCGRTAGARNRAALSVALAAVESLPKAVPEAIIGVGMLGRAVDFAAAGRVGAGLQRDTRPQAGTGGGGFAAVRDFPLLPGVMTPTDVIAARSPPDCNVLQLFPPERRGNIAMLHALAGPFPDVLFCPTGRNRAPLPRLPRAAQCPLRGRLVVAPRALVAAGDDGVEALAPMPPR